METYKWILHTNKFPIKISTNPRKCQKLSKLLVLGGAETDISRDCISTELYDPHLHKWIIGKDLPSQRFNFSGVFIDNRVILMGGWNNDHQHLDSVGDSIVWEFQEF